MANKNDNKSLYIYTALIFFVAVILIILSFFGQTNIQKNQPKIEENSEQTQQANGITERTAVLSEENKTLIEENKKISKENESLKTENETLTKRLSVSDLLFSVNGYLSIGEKEKALEVFNKINSDLLTNDQKILYNDIKNNLQ